MDGNSQSKLSVGARLGLAWKCFWQILGQSEFADKINRALATPTPVIPTPVTPTPVSVPAVPPERLNASGLLVLSLFQREGRLIDFLQENVASFSDTEVGAAARVVHAGCKKALADHFTLEP